LTFLRNTWYVAGWSAELSDAIVGRTILEEPVAFFRDAGGAVCAISDRCPHRFAPLHLGKHLGDVIECGYHGLRFDRTGACVFNPQGGKIPSSARVKAYPCIERYGLIWIWMGAAEPDDATIPDMSFIVDPRYATASGGYLHAKCNYQLYIDNLLDLTHAQFLHSSTLGSATISSDSVVSIRQEQTSVFVDRLVPNTPGAPRYDELLHAGGAPIDHWIDMRWDPPGIMRLSVGAAFPNQPRANGVNIFAAHMVTPETSTSTHYFFSASRQFNIDDDEATRKHGELQHVIFETEDKPMLEAQQRNAPNADLFAANPLSLPGDAGALRVRRLLRTMIESEQASNTAAVW
jgi:phenylpropionate dioxygenase-like ring-hydroxylating dioxygenase large terminal subunit